MAALLSITVCAELELRRSTTSSCGSTDSPTVYRPQLRTANSSSSGPDAGNKLLPLTTAGPHTLAWPTGLLATGFYIRALDENAAEYDLTLAREGGAQVASGVRGMYFLEASESNRIIGVTLSGSGNFEWAAW